MDATDLQIMNDKRPVEGSPDQPSPKEVVVPEIELETEVPEKIHSTGKQFKLAIEGLVFGRFRTKYVMSDADG